VPEGVGAYSDLPRQFSRSDAHVTDIIEPGTDSRVKRNLLAVEAEMSTGGREGGQARQICGGTKVARTWFSGHVAGDRGTDGFVRLLVTRRRFLFTTTCCIE
jgi:hypothetical protein